MLADWEHTGAKGHVVDGSSVAVDLLQYPIVTSVPDGGGAIFTTGYQESPCWIQTNSVHLEMEIEKTMPQVNE